MKNGLKAIFTNFSSIWYLLLITNLILSLFGISIFPNDAVWSTLEQVFDLVSVIMIAALPSLFSKNPEDKFTRYLMYIYQTLLKIKKR